MMSTKMAAQCIVGLNSKGLNVRPARATVERQLDCEDCIRRMIRVDYISLSNGCSADHRYGEPMSLVDVEVSQTVSPYFVCMAYVSCALPTTWAALVVVLQDAILLVPANRLSVHARGPSSTRSPIILCLIQLDGNVSGMWQSLSKGSCRTVILDNIE